jgi:L-fuculose-phosphate aldolase
LCGISLISSQKSCLQKNLNSAISGGNLSISDNEGNIWITPAGIDKGALTRQDIVCVHGDGTVEGVHKPLSELPFHQSVYRRRPDIKSVLHAHPSSLVAFSIARKLPDVSLIPTVARTCGEVAMATYAVPGSEELGENIAQKFDNGINIVLLENHGICIGAKDLFTAFMQFETMEYVASLQIVANKIGTPNSLTREAINVTLTRNHLLMDDFIPKTHSNEECAARRDMITLIRRSYRHGLFSATHGTYSVRLQDSSFLITPFGKDRAYLEEEDLVRVKAGMKEQGKTPSRAVAIHQAIYDANPEINAILLAHPLHVMAFAVTDATFDPRTIPESYIQLREICKRPYEELYTRPTEAAALYSQKVPAVIYKNDCVIVTGATLLQAFDRLEVAEATAHSIISSHDIGAIQHITDEEIADLKKAFNLED